MLRHQETNRRIQKFLIGRTPGSNPERTPINWVKAHYDSIHGRISCQWRRTPEQFELIVEIPANTTARSICHFSPATSSPKAATGLLSSVGRRHEKRGHDFLSQSRARTEVWRIFNRFVTVNHHWPKISIHERLSETANGNQIFSTDILTGNNFELFNTLEKQGGFASTISLKHHFHSHFYSHLGFCKNQNPYFTLVFMALLKIGAGEGNRIMAVIFHNSLNCSITVHSELPNLDIPASKSTVTNDG